MSDSGAPLTPVLRWFRVFAIALAAISPTTSVFLVYHTRDTLTQAWNCGVSASCPVTPAR